MRKCLKTNRISGDVQSIESFVLPYKKGSVKIHGGEAGQITLISHKETGVLGSNRTEIWFISALIQKGYVGFYYMPIYGYRELAKQLHPDLMKRLKGNLVFI